MTKGQTVMVYEDPITRLRSEGRAKLLEAIIQPPTDIQDMDGLEYWRVEFENEPGKLYPRWVSNK